jgi:hypothetical protein
MSLGFINEMCPLYDGKDLRRVCTTVSCSPNYENCQVFKKYQEEVSNTSLGTGTVRDLEKNKQGIDTQFE